MFSIVIIQVLFEIVNIHIKKSLFLRRKAHDSIYRNNFPYLRIMHDSNKQKFPNCGKAA